MFAELANLKITLKVGSATIPDYQCESKPCGAFTREIIKFTVPSYGVFFDYITDRCERNNQVHVEGVMELMGDKRVTELKGFYVSALTITTDGTNVVLERNRKNGK
jgi:hypothetical protein